MRRCGIVLCGWASGCAAQLPLAPEPPSVEPELAAALQDALDTARLATRAPAAVVAVRRGSDGALWVGASGEADPATGRPAAPHDQLHIGSITKTYVAAEVVSQAEGGALSLDDPLDVWLPDAPHAERLTVRHLLDHTSGLEDYATAPAILGSLDQPHTAWELVAAVADAPLRFEPGADHAYANTNYVLLGLVLEAATGAPWGQLVDQRISALGLRATSTGGAPTVTGHVGGVDTTGAFDPSIAGAAGRMVASAADVARWGALLAAGEAVSPQALEAMATPTPTSLGEGEAYGLGLMVLDLPDEAPPDVALGHSGSVIGFQSRLRVRRGDGTAVATLASDFVAEADEIDRAIWAALGIPLP
jgi:D-alanyl-D-alanine carboxypeptidase